MKKRKAQIFLMVGAVMVCLMMGLTSAARAADVTVGLGLGVAPEYEGSEDYQAVPIPFLK